MILTNINNYVIALLVLIMFACPQSASATDCDSDCNSDCSNENNVFNRINKLFNPSDRADKYADPVCVSRCEVERTIACTIGASFSGCTFWRTNSDYLRVTTMLSTIKRNNIDFSRSSCHNFVSNIETLTTVYGIMRTDFARILDTTAAAAASSFIVPIVVREAAKHCAHCACDTLSENRASTTAEMQSSHRDSVFVALISSSVNN